MTKRNKILTRTVIWVCAVLMSLPPGFVPEAAAQDCIDIADMPLISETGSSNANIFFLIDDSGSMDWEFAVKDEALDEAVSGRAGRWVSDRYSVSYLYDHVDHHYINDNSNGRILWDTDYENDPQYAPETASRKRWRATFSKYNNIYYDPGTYYEPWITATGDPMADADPDNPRIRPVTTDFPDPTDSAELALWYRSLDDRWTELGEAGGEYQGVIISRDCAGNADCPDLAVTVNDINEWHEVVNGTDDYPEVAGVGYYTETSGESVEFVQTFGNNDPIAPSDNYYVEGWVPCHENGDESASVTIVSDGQGNNTTTTNYTWNQRTDCGRWVRLSGGTAGETTEADLLDFNSNNFQGSVTISRGASSNGATLDETIRFINADGVRAEAANPPGESTSLFIPISHYYVWDDADNDDVQDVNEVYLVILNSDDTVVYYQMTTVPDDATDLTRDNLTLVTEDAVPAACQANTFRNAENYNRSPDITARQNFANWYQYYRRRFMMSVYAISNAINQFSGVRIGIGGINALVPNSPAEYDDDAPGIVEKVIPIDEDGNRERLLEALFNYDHISGYQSTPLRQGYYEVGQYFDVEDGNQPQDKLGPSPLTLYEGAECGLNFIVAFTDGYYSGRAANNQPGADQIDVWAENSVQISGCEPYESSATNSFADLVMDFYAWDIADNIADEVQPFSGILPDSPPDWVTWQHIVTYTVVFGVEGSLNKDDYNIYGPSSEENPITYPPWPSSLNRDPYLVDDVYHGAVNGRGQFFNAQSSQELIDAFAEIADRLNERIGAGARATSNMTELVSGAMLFMVEYNGFGWSGELTARNLNTDTENLVGDVAWEAHTLLENLIQDSGHTARNIATYDGSGGAAFEWGSIGATNQGNLMYDAVTAGGRTGDDLVNYLRGDKTYEERNGGIFRDRLTAASMADLIEGGEMSSDSFTLSDIVHSSATFEEDGNMVYVGANDGFLHAFNATTGQEQFAYAPSFVMENMKLLSQPDYDHKFMVDETPVVQDTGDVTLLVGGLGKGGRGIYCLDITDPSANTQANASTWVKWEFPNTQSAAYVPDMGYTFGQPNIVKTQRTSQPWVVIFNNGYASSNGNAVLFIVDALDGSYIKHFDTEVGDCNGLSNIIVTDPDGNDVADYVYAGDLKGNMWKFDLTDEDPANWDIAYKAGSRPAPLFTAVDENGDPQPITGKPDAMEHCDSTKPGYIVVFGTGRFLTMDDIGSTAAATQQQTVYGVWDFGDDDDDAEYLGTFDRANLTVSNQTGLNMVEQTITIDGDSGSLSCNDLCWGTMDDATDPDQDSDPDTSSAACEVEDPNNPEATIDVPASAGWFMDLSTEDPLAGERVVFDIMIIEGSAYILTLAPDISGEPCSRGGTSGIYIVNACDGGCDLPVDEESSADSEYADRYDYDSGYDVFDRHGDQLAITEPEGGSTSTSSSTSSHSGSDSPNVTVGDAAVGLTVFYNPETGQWVLPPTQVGGGIGPVIETEAQNIGLIYWRIVD